MFLLLPVSVLHHSYFIAQLCPPRKYSTDVAPKTGIVMLNMGGPTDISQVHDYLLRIMTDTDMIQFPVMQE